MSDDRDEQGRPWRWRKPLSFADADALARRWAEGDIISEPERYERLRSWIQERVGIEVDKRSYGQLRQVRAWMAERGITEAEVEADPNLVQQTLCEALCAQEIIGRGLKGNDMDIAFWDCIHQCSPVIDPMTIDPSSPLYPHSQEPTPDEFTTTFSLPPKEGDQP
jgi:hypothetical protein